MHVQVGTHFVKRILAVGAVCTLCGIKTQKAYRLERAVLLAAKTLTWAVKKQQRTILIIFHRI